MEKEIFYHDEKFQGGEEMGEKVLKKVVIFSVISLFAIFFTNFPSVAQDESSCIKCHTSPKTLIELTRELAKKKPPKKSAETKGEG